MSTKVLINEAVPRSVSDNQRDFLGGLIYNKQKGVGHGVQEG